MKKLSEYNFKIMYQTEVKNVKVNALTHKSDDKSVNKENDQLKYQHQILLTLKRLEIHVLKLEPEAVIHDRILFVNQKDEKYTAFHTAIANNRKAYN